jgi:hypothetical protein
MCSFISNTIELQLLSLNAFVAYSLLWLWFILRLSVDQLVLVSGSPLGPMTRFYLYPFFWQFLCSSYRAPSLMRGRVCNLQCNRWLVRSLRTLPSHLRLCSLFVSSYESQGLRCRYSNPPTHWEFVVMLCRCSYTVTACCAHEQNYVSLRSSVEVYFYCLALRARSCVWLCC